ncbi:MAG: GTPase, partial [Planctomycetota bacterium]
PEGCPLAFSDYERAGHTRADVEDFERAMRARARATAGAAADGRELKEIERRKENSLSRRRSEFVVALVGYTNAGKSTLLNRLTSSEELVEDKLFATLDTRVRRWLLNKTRYVLVTDTVGFIRDLPHHLVASFHATLAETREADLLLHVVDASSPDAPWQIRTVENVLEDLECGDKDRWLVLNKWDAVPDEKLIDAQNLKHEARRVREAKRGRTRSQHRRFVDRQAPVSDVTVSNNDEAEPNPNGAGVLAVPRSVTLSAHTGEGIPDLRDVLLDHIRRNDRHHVLTLPHERGDVLAYIRENGEIEETKYGEEGVLVNFGISEAREARLKHMYPEGFPKPVPEPWE